MEAAAPFAGPELLLPEERGAVTRAVEKRVREFATGRVLARRALGRLGRPSEAIPAAEDRSPAWPPGVVGSITHTHGLCVVACTTPARVRAIGVDVERLRDLRDGLEERILRPEERAERVLPTLAYFCAKEALYKCQYPLTSRFLEFQDVRVRFDDEGAGFEATVLVFEEGSALRTVRGRLAMTQEFVFAVAVG